jgi:hypothetical protein
LHIQISTQPHTMEGACMHPSVHARSVFILGSVHLRLYIQLV